MIKKDVLMEQEKPIGLIHLIYRFSSPLASVVFMIFGSAFFTTFISVFLYGKGYGKHEIGYVQSAYFCGMLIGAFQMERLIKRVGHIQALAVFGSLATSITLSMALYQNFAAWMLLRFLSGLSMAALYIVIESWMLEESSLKTRGVILSVYMICLTSAQSLSQQVLSFVDIYSYTPFLISAVFTSLSVIPVGLSTNRVTIPTELESVSFLKIAKSSPFGVAGCFAAGLIMSTIYSFFPIYSESIRIPSADLMSVTIAGGVLLQWPIGKLSDYFERRRTILTVIAITLALSLLALISSTFNMYNTLLLFFFLGGFIFTLYPLSVTQVCDHLDQSDITTALSLLLIAFGLGSVGGPTTSAFLVAEMGISSIFLYFAVLLGGLFMVGMISTIQRPIVPLEEQNDFIPLPTATPVAYEMDPRGEGDLPE
ncbi:putative permease, major facilitator superfamily [Waddlia chondrophila 2032/99]|uniref:Putative permease, major facilitator superfamily n=3 Tax=Waddlia chondrophila TaxID=71667 RepID=D6YTG8_WADCW|nr:putative permease, major facilitator superfamily [Waddlia chondrophila WSU 86-1044]CCB90852.1 putative permease, major facilitator superfamily [Waddlia chondrophila 2032/99]